MSQPRKPTGETGAVTIGPAGASWGKVQFPAAKRAVEAFVAGLFVTVANRDPHNLGLSQLRQNSENDLDFLLASPSGDVLLELMEIAPLLKGGFASAPATYDDYTFAIFARDAIMTKSSRYQGISSPVHLLLYVTHFAFILSVQITACLQYFFNTRSHRFAAIYLLYPTAQDDAILELVCPGVPVRAEFESLRGMRTTNLHPTDFRLVPPPHGGA